MTFAKFVLNRFFSLAAQNNKAYVELLFWKNVGAVREMTEGYGIDRLVHVLVCPPLCKADCCRCTSVRFYDIDLNLHIKLTMKWQTYQLCYFKFCISS